MNDIKEQNTMDDLREIPFAEESIYDGRILRVARWKVTCPNGREATREIVKHNGAAAVVPVFADGTTILVRQHRVAIDEVTLEIPAGKLESPEEDPLCCAERELREETGLLAERMKHLTTIWTTPGFCTERIALYLAEGLTQGDADPDEDEVLRLVRLPLGEAVAMAMRGELRDSKTVCGLLMAQKLLSERARA